MRTVLGVAVAAGLLTGCGGPAPATDTAPVESGTAVTDRAVPATGRLDPTRIKRLRAALPAGYEIADVPGDTGPAAFAGFGPGWTADPPVCATLLGPAAPVGTRGLSASGADGTVYLTVTLGDVAPPPVGDCGSWTMTYRHTTALAHPVPAPPIEGARTAGLAAESVTAVESGTRTLSRLRILTAALDGQLVAVTTITDPQQPPGPLTDEYTARLLVDAVTELRRVH